MRMISQLTNELTNLMLIIFIVKVYTCIFLDSHKSEKPVRIIPNVQIQIITEMPYPTAAQEQVFANKSSNKF